MDPLALLTMKNAAKCDTKCELQNAANHHVFERTLRLKGLVTIEPHLTEGHYKQENPPNLSFCPLWSVGRVGGFLTSIRCLYWPRDMRRPGRGLITRIPGPLKLVPVVFCFPSFSPSQPFAAFTGCGRQGRKEGKAYWDWGSLGRKETFSLYPLCRFIFRVGRRYPNK
jgi:hypothetical protein